jgi:hypothetical protein
MRSSFPSTTRSAEDLRADESFSYFDGVYAIGDEPELDKPDRSHGPTATSPSTLQPIDSSALLICAAGIPLIFKKRITSCRDESLVTADIKAFCTSAAVLN